MSAKGRLRWVSVSLAMLAIALVLTFSATTNAAGDVSASLIGTRAIVGVAIGVVLFVFSALLCLTTFDRGRSAAWLRLDWFSPALRRQPSDESVSHSLPGRWLRRWLPERFQSNRQTKQRGLIRRWSRKLGITFLASPARRLTQATCLLLFLWLFFYVCWPYHAQPRDTPRVSSGWRVTQIDQAIGRFVLENPAHKISESTRKPSDFLSVSQLVYVTKEEGTELTPSSSLGPFTLSPSNDQALRLSPTAETRPEMIDALVLSNGPLSIWDRDPQAWPSHYADSLASKEIVSAEVFLAIDPLVSLSTAIASRNAVWSLGCAAIILLVCVLIPRGFCGYLCPLGTTIDLFDWLIAGRTKRFRVPGDGWWVHIKYYLLAGTLAAAVGGVLVSGVFSAIPIITRAMLFLGDPLQSGLTRGWHLVPSIGVGQFISVGLFAVVLGLGFLRPRFWCKYVCPSGAVFSLGNLFRVTERKVESSCINCNKCVEICPFDAIKPDFTTRTTDCTMCQSCGGVCPTHAIKFVERWNVVELKVENDPPTNETAIGRRGFMSLAAGSTAAVVGGAATAGVTKVWGADLNDPQAFRPVRPPGSVPEQEFLEMCIRCGECFKACPNNVLQPEGFQQGLEGLWSPMVNADWAGCESSCNACGQVCPTGAIRALPLAEKKVARMGLAIVNESTCLPFAGSQECDLCVQECNAAGYHAIEFKQVGTELDASGIPIAGTGYLAPVVMEDKCVGCGLCQTRCYAINVKEEGLLTESAIIIEAGAGKEDRLLTGSYLERRKRESEAREPAPLPEVVPDTEGTQDLPPSSDGEDPFGLDDPFGLGDP